MAQSEDTWVRPSRARDDELKERAFKVIPNGMFGHQSTILLPGSYPQFFSRARGSHIWDADGNDYVDYMCAYGPNLFGYGHEGIEAAALKQMSLGDTMTGPSEVIVELAEDLVGMVGHADWAIFCKNGTDATSMAMVIARTHTGRRKVLCASGAYHGAASWCSPFPAGILPEDRAHIVYYEYNNPQSLFDAFSENKNDVAAVFATPFRHETFTDQYSPDLDYAKAARRLCDETGALLVIDDVRAGFRISRDCSWSTIGIQPDLSAWGKCIANGFSISALLGSEIARAAAAKTFVTGSFWYSAAAMAASRETLKQIRETGYLEHTIEIGEQLRTGLHRQAQSHGYGLRQTGPAQMPQILFEDDHDFRLGYAWAGACVERGAYLHPFHNMFISAAHTLEDVERTLEITDDAFRALKATAHSLGPVKQLELLPH